MLVNTDSLPVAAAEHIAVAAAGYKQLVGLELELELELGLGGAEAAVAGIVAAVDNAAAVAVAAVVPVVVVLEAFVAAAHKPAAEAGSCYIEPWFRGFYVTVRNVCGF